MLINTLRLLHASEAATQSIPYYVHLDYANLFKIQHVRNAFPLKPVSFSRLVSYLECPGCALDQKPRRRTKEPKHFTNIHQTTMFGGRQPDPRLVGTLLHQIINLLHDERGPLTEAQRTSLLTYPDQLTGFLRHDLLQALRTAEKFKLAIFLDELSAHEDTLRTALISPLLRYQQELILSGSMVFAISERFQFKLLSTGKTFAGHNDWGGEVAVVGEFDQIRLRNIGSELVPGGTPAIIEFKKGLGQKKGWWDTLGLALEDKDAESASDGLSQPGMAHALQLAIYWLAFQTRWDVVEHVLFAKGRNEDVSMSLHQNLDLILYNLQDGCQYQLLFTDQSTALLALTNCIFHLNWAMKSGYAWQAPDHECSKTALLTEVPQCEIQVGYGTISAEECYLLAREAFLMFKETICWKKLATE
jgi:hypothetical protein